MIVKVKNRILAGGKILFREAVELSKLEGSQIYELLLAANQIREKFSGKKIDLCSIVSAKTGRCSEDCKFCAQSEHHKAKIEYSNILGGDEIVEKAKKAAAQGAHRFSIVSSGYALTDEEFARVLIIYSRIKRETALKLCASLGSLGEERAHKLMAAGVTMYHHNIETAKDFYPKICTTHSYADKIRTIEAVQRTGMKICCGGIISMGETMADRIKMAFEIKELKVDSVPLNILNPLAGTPLENQVLLSPLEILKTIALFRFILPNVMLRLAGGRLTGLKDLHPMGFLAGINGLLMGNYLTTEGRSTEEDLEMLKDLGYEIGD